MVYLCLCAFQEGNPQDDQTGNVGGGGTQEESGRDHDDGGYEWLHICAPTPT